MLLYVVCFCNCDMKIVFEKASVEKLLSSTNLEVGGAQKQSVLIKVFTQLSFDVHDQLICGRPLSTSKD